MRSIVLAATLVVTLVAAPVAGAATAKVTFFGHVFASGLNAPMPSNDQPPEGEEVFGVGSTNTCTPVGTFDNYIPPPPPTASPGVDCDKDPQNKLALFSSAGFVDVKGRDEFNSKGDYTLFHNERGSTKAIQLDPAEDVTASLWMSLDPIHVWYVGGGSNETDCPYANPRDVGCVYPYWGWDPGLWPDWVVKATLYAAVLGDHGSDPSKAPPIHEALTAGTARVIAEGETAPIQVVNGLPGNPNVHQFVVNLGKPKATTIEREESFFLVFSWYSKTGDTKYTFHYWRLWAGEFFPPVYTLPVTNAFDVELVIPSFVYDKLVIVGVINTPWGSYDVDPSTTRLTIEEKATRREVTPLRVSTFSDYSTAHGGHYKPVNETWVWDYKGDRLAPGTYTATVTAENWAHSARGACTAEFTILPDGSPGPVTVGACGERTASDELVEELRNLEGEGRDGTDLSPGPLPSISVLSSDAHAVPGPGALLAALALAGLAFAARRGRP
ncbi:MAG TPA: hypothetical protein VI997_00015 [Candidatus Thermoplasmatota archaeon]|nr:hypothetical protein [Candidatus Thermoplasmatota archaeon]